jgi:N-acetylglutamate synthase-like GNAT family acetyltransferase
MLTIRPATPDDIPEILAFIRELAEYEKEPASAVATHADLSAMASAQRSVSTA